MFSSLLLSRTLIPRTVNRLIPSSIHNAVSSSISPPSTRPSSAFSSLNTTSSSSLLLFSFRSFSSATTAAAPAAPAKKKKLSPTKKAKLTEKKAEEKKEKKVQAAVKKVKKAKAKTVGKKKTISKLTPEQKEKRLERRKLREAKEARIIGKLRALFYKSIHPQRPPTTYALFYKEKYPEISSKNPTLKAIDIAKIVGEQWNKSDETIKKKYEEKADVLQRQYKKDLEVFTDKYAYKPYPLSKWTAFYQGRAKELIGQGTKLTVGKDNNIMKKLSIEFKSLSEEEQNNNKYYNQKDFEKKSEEIKKYNEGIDAKNDALFKRWLELRKANRTEKINAKKKGVSSS